MRPQLYILEGPDAAGKTTLATNLADRTNGMIFRCTWKPRLGEAIVDYFDNVLDNAAEALKLRGRSFIIDRFWPSEWVYGTLKKRNVLTPQKASRLDARIKGLGGVYVFCSSSTHEQVRRHAVMKDPEHPYEDEFYTEVCGRYFAWWKIMDPCTIIHRYDLRIEGQDVARFMHNLESDVNDRVGFERVRPINPSFITL